VYPPVIRFDDDHCRQYIPLRLPATVCVTERLPAGAAAVLLNRGHLHHDLVLVVDAAEKLLFDAIDGRRTVAEIAGVAGNPAPWTKVRSFFEKLWQYDQVVFDASNSV
jgi:hypothetical protein